MSFPQINVGNVIVTLKPLPVFSSVVLTAHCVIVLDACTRLNVIPELKYVLTNRDVIQRFNLGNLPIYCRTLEYFSECNSEDVKSPALPEDPPWHYKNCNVDVSLY